MITQKEIRTIIRTIAEKYNLPYKTVEEICFSQFKYVKEEMSKGTQGEPDTFKNVLLKHLGTFSAHKGKIKYSTKNKKEKDDRSTDRERKSNDEFLGDTSDI